MKSLAKLATALALTTLLAGCAQPPVGTPCRDTQNPYACRNQRSTGNLLGGALVGGAGGAIIGALTGDAGLGAAIGVGAGALGGALMPTETPQYQPQYAQPYQYQPYQPGY